MGNFTQNENEALVRLMLAGRCQDGIVSLSEGEEFDRQIGSLQWVSDVDLKFFVVTEAARIRKTMATRREEFIAAQCACLRSDASRAAAVAMLNRVLKADGADPRENAFVASVQKALGTPRT